jgi:hypothetical protein
MQYIYATYRFLICLILSEKKRFNDRINYYIFFFKSVDIVKYIFYLFDKNINPFKSNEFIKSIKSNKKKWKEFSKKINVSNSKETILIENFVGHPWYTFSNILIGKYLQLLNGSQCIGLLRKGDIKGEVLFRSFGIDKFYYYKTWSFFKRCKYIYRSISILKDIKDIKKFCEIKIKKIDIGLLSYDTFMRYTRNPTAKEVNSKLILFFAEGLFASDFFEKIFYNKNITKLVQAEILFIPLSILFQKSLLKKKMIYSRIGGTNLISLRIYTKFDQRYKYRGTSSKKLFDEIYKNYKTKSIKLINKYYEEKIRKKFYGAHEGTTQEKIIVLNSKDKNFLSMSKSNLCKIFNWDKNKKIATIFLHILIDGNYKFGRRNMFLDNYTWARHTIETIKKIKNINWIVKEHPHEKHYNTKFNFSLFVKNLEKKYNHIRWYPENFSPASLIKFTDVAITSSGSAGVEYPSFGIPSIIAEKSDYSGLGFALEPKSKIEYKNLLKHAHQINKLSKQKIEKAKVFLFIRNILLKNKLSIMPPNRKINENDFWYQINQNLKKFNLNNDKFKKSFNNQIKLKLRHTVNLDLCSIKNRILNDY